MSCAAQLDRGVSQSVVQAIIKGAMDKNAFFRADGHVYLSAEKWQTLSDGGMQSRQKIMEALFVQGMNTCD
jgi:hypothetical protein